MSWTHLSFPLSLPPSLSLTLSASQLWPGTTDKRTDFDATSRAWVLAVMWHLDLLCKDRGRSPKSLPWLHPRLSKEATPVVTGLERWRLPRPSISLLALPRNHWPNEGLIEALKPQELLRQLQGQHTPQQLAQPQTRWTGAFSTKHHMTATGLRERGDGPEILAEGESHPPSPKQAYFTP